MEVIYIRASTSKSYKLRNINAIARGSRNIAVEPRKIYNWEPKVIPFVINFTFNSATSIDFKIKV